MVNVYNIIARILKTVQLKRLSLNRLTIPHKYINYHVKAKQHSKLLLVANRIWKICRIPNPLLYSWSLFRINTRSQPITGTSPLVCCLYPLGFCSSLSVVSNVSALILPCASRSASHSNFPHFTYFLRSFTGTCQQNLPANLLADVDIFQEYVRHCTRNLNKMKKNADFLEDAELEIPYAKSLQLYKDWEPSVTFHQINSSIALCPCTSSGVFYHQLLLPQTWIWEFSTMLLLSQMMCKLDKQLRRIDTQLDHHILESPFVHRELLLPSFLNLHQELMRFFFPFYFLSVYFYCWFWSLTKVYDSNSSRASYAFFLFSKPLCSFPPTPSHILGTKTTSFHFI